MEISQGDKEDLIAAIESVIVLARCNDCKGKCVVSESLYGCLVVILEKFAARLNREASK